MRESVLDLAPSPGNPRNSEGSFARLPDGDILFVYSSFRGDRAADHTPADLWKVLSHDGGRTWETPCLLKRASDYGAMNIMSVSLLPLNSGELALFYLVRMSWLAMPMVMQRSADGGKTWGDPVYCTPKDRYFVVNNDRVIRLSSGRILIPAAEHENRMDGEKLVFAPALTTFFYSDDEGVTWHETEERLRLEIEGCASGLQEPGAVEGRDGRLFGWARTDLGCQYVFSSTDGGLTWTAPVPSRFASPLSPLSIRPLRDGRLMAVWNPVPASPLSGDIWADGTGGRHPLVWAFSGDDGQTWSEPEILEGDPRGGYCYTAIFETDEGVLLAYCAGTATDGSCLNRLRIRFLPLKGSSVK